MDDIEDYLRSLSKWSGEVISTLERLSKVQDLHAKELKNTKDCINDLQLSFEKRTTSLEVKMKLIGTALFLLSGSVIGLLIDFLSRHLI